MTEKMEEIIILIQENFKWGMDDAALERMIIKYIGEPDQALYQSIEDYLMDNASIRKSVFTKEICMKIKGYKKASRAQSYGGIELDYIIDEMQYTIEFMIQTKLHGRRPMEIHKSARHLYTRPEKSRQKSFNEKIKNFTLKDDGTVSINIDQVAQFVTLVKSIIEDEKWVDLPTDTYYWFIQKGGVYKYILLSNAISNWLTNMDNWLIDLRDILIDEKKLNSLLIQCRNENMTFAQTFKDKVNVIENKIISVVG